MPVTDVRPGIAPAGIACAGIIRARLLAGASVAIMLLPVVAQAHAPTGSGALSTLPIRISQLMLATAWFAYLIGGFRVPANAMQQACMHAAMLIAALALFGPLDDLAAHSTAAHMLQHMLLIAVVAPLWVLARPLAQWRAAGGRIADGWWRFWLRSTRHPGLCAVIHAAMLWFWHLPGPYMAAVSNSWLHALEHLCFVFSAWLFWWSVLRAGRRAAMSCMLALLFTLMQTGLLGALLTFASVPLYDGESRDLADQQMAGLLMWVPGGLAYLVAAVWCSHRWVTGSARKAAMVPPRPGSR